MVDFHVKEEQIVYAFRVTCSVLPREYSLVPTSRIGRSVDSFIRCTKSLSRLRFVRKELDTKLVPGGNKWSWFLFSTVFCFSSE